jgi:poly-gamma-glutamate synthesis protein (capsule biosynthesis protein)
MGEKNGYDSFFVDIATLLHSADLVVVNLEGPITENKSKTLLGDGSLTKSYSFTFSTTTAGAMSRAGIGAVSLANNHMDNMSFQGFVETKKWLNENFISYFGDPWNSTSTELLYDSDGFRLAFVGYHGFQSGLANILSDISRLSREGYFVIVMPHWGEEYIEVNTPKMKEFAEAFISSGAKAIFGSHPHVVLNNEWIGEVPVFYSLGNLLFDQYWNDRVTNGQLVAMYLRLDEGEIVIDNMEIYDTSIKSRKKIELL